MSFLHVYRKQINNSIIFLVSCLFNSKRGDVSEQLLIPTTIPFSLSLSQTQAHIDTHNVYISYMYVQLLMT